MLILKTRALRQNTHPELRADKSALLTLFKARQAQATLDRTRLASAGRSSSSSAAASSSGGGVQLVGRRPVKRDRTQGTQTDDVVVNASDRPWGPSDDEDSLSSFEQLLTAPEVD